MSTSGSMSASTSASTSAKSTVEEIGEFYDDMGGMIEVLGGNIHVGYWEDDNDRTPLLEAISRFTVIVGDKLGLRPGQHLLDVGCGVGMTAIRLAQRTDADVTGVTNSEWQVVEATRRANTAGLRGQVRIEFGDAAALEYPDGSFDAVLSFESLPHAQDRGRWLREMVRVLRPGGRAVLTEFAEEAPLTEEEVGILRAGALAPPLMAPHFIDVVRSSGLAVDEVVDCGERIRRSYTEYFERFARLRPGLVAEYGEDKVDEHEQGLRMLLPIYREKIGYLIVVGHKPVGHKP
jgi:cyclopropane fatty-acyl-phospholipid synthase-like methyltransferase